MNVSTSLRGLLAISLVAPVSALSALSSRPSVDQALTIIKTFEPQVRASFDDLLPTHGQVRIIICVDDSGKLVDWLPVSYAHRTYLKAVEEALKEWRYQPARVGGEPIGVRQMLVFNFESRGQVASFTAVEVVDSLFGRAFGHRDVQCVYPGRELDSAPKPVKVVQPLWVQAAENLPAGAGVLVDFYIDQNGKPRMPTASNYDHPMIALAAVHALEQWEFSVPTRGGQPVVVHASQWFAFGPQNPSPGK